MGTLLFPTGSKVKIKTLYDIELDDLIEKRFVSIDTPILGGMLVEIPLEAADSDFVHALTVCYNWLKKRTAPEQMTEPISTNIEDYTEIKAPD